ncbi:MAG TPA: NADH-quinone oxidoreductase subunit NuoE [Deltaproteobacteria bacterium]|nr:NADH-quinone oxidoreductase subunit NuoE [Deltaproteobacteria bacterium]
MAFEFTPENRTKFDAILTRYPVKRAAMLPALWLAQRQHGWISQEVMEYVGSLLGLSAAKVYEVVTFYTMFHLKPIGKYHFQVCRTLPCQLVGAEAISSHLEKKLGVKIGETSADGRFTLSEVECLGSCGTGPMLQLNDDYHENLTAEKLDALIASLS